MFYYVKIFDASQLRTELRTKADFNLGAGHGTAMRQQ